MKLKNIYFVSLLFLSTIIIRVSAAKHPTLTFLTDNQEVFLEVINVIVALIGVVIAIRVMKLVGGSQLEVGVKYIVIAMISFAILEIYALLKQFVISISGLGDVIELITIVSLLLGFYNMYKSLK